MKKNSNFYSLIINLTRFIVFTILFYFFVLYLGHFLPNNLTPNVLYNKRDSTTTKRITEASSNKLSLDILFIGSSHASRGYDVRIFKNNGYESFNLGSSSQTPMQSELLLKKYISTLQPSLVIFDVYPIMFTIDGAESGLDLIVNSPMDKDILGHLFKLNNIKVYNGFIYRYLSSVFSINDSKKFKKDFKYIKGGFEEFNSNKYKRDEYLVDKKLIWNKNQIKSFLNIVKHLKKNKIPFCLFESPVTKKLYHSYKNHHEFDSIMKMNNLDYIDFNKRNLNLIDTVHFADKDHLNLKGIKIYNKYILDYIVTK